MGFRESEKALRLYVLLFVNEIMSFYFSWREDLYL